MDGGVAGLLGLVNKAAGFTPADCEVAATLAQMASAFVLNDRTVKGLEQRTAALEEEVRDQTAHLREAEQRFRTLIENLPDIVARFDRDLRYLYVSPALQTLIGRSKEAYAGRTNQDLGMPAELVDAWNGALRRVFDSGMRETLELEYATAERIHRFECWLVPERGADGDITSVLTVARDVTDRWEALEAAQRESAIAAAMRDATIELTRCLDREAVLSTLLDRLRVLVPFDRGRVMLVGDAFRLSIHAAFDGDRVVPLPAAERPEFDATDYPIVHRILTTGSPVLIRDVRDHPDWSLPVDLPSDACWMGIPLFARDSVAGLFSLSRREAGYFNEEHVRLAEAMSSQASVAVENAVLFEQMRMSTVRMQSLSRRLVDAQEIERRSIARELHDEAGQTLISLRYGLRLLEREARDGGEISEMVAELVQRTDAVIDGLHRLAADLRPAALDFLGLEAAVRQYLRSIGARFGLSIHFKPIGLQGARLPAAVETGLYRVVQEAITNVVRHARASQVDVLIERRAQRVSVMIEDDGAGFDPAAALRGDRLGLLGLRERAVALGGTLTLESRPGRGTTVVVEVSGDDPNSDR